MVTPMKTQIRFEETLQEGMATRRRELNGSAEKFHFFWETKSPFSQWFKANFTAPALDLNGNGLPEDFSGELSFSSAEQFMMLHKALLFDDFESARAIYRTKNVRDQKALGRGIRNFEDAKWKSYRSLIVYRGNREKFSQNAALQNELILTQGMSLVESAPDDAVWGIGLAKEDPRAWNRETWLGSNLLGEILTHLRIELTGSY
jgi:ribA/ribD-fused uncharacterized protein